MSTTLPRRAYGQPQRAEDPARQEDRVLYHFGKLSTWQYEGKGAAIIIVVCAICFTLIVASLKVRGLL